MTLQQQQKFAYQHYISNQQFPFFPPNHQVWNPLAYIDPSTVNINIYNINITNIHIYIYMRVCMPVCLNCVDIG